ncbi:MAG: hypothetical protein IKE24_04880 [Clostridia bacterium]|nr:hypothetical protein [Clostridia bacterium]
MNREVRRQSGTDGGIWEAGMEEQRREVYENPFSKEKAWETFTENRERSIALREAFRKGALEGAPVREQILRAVEAVGRMTDNTIFLRIVKRALETRDPT